jgi:hypothetical protein
VLRKLGDIEFGTRLGIPVQHQFVPQAVKLRCNDRAVYHLQRSRYFLGGAAEKWLPLRRPREPNSSSPWMLNMVMCILSFRPREGCAGRS